MSETQAIRLSAQWFRGRLPLQFYRFDKEFGDIDRLTQSARRQRACQAAEI